MGVHPGGRLTPPGPRDDDLGMNSLAGAEAAEHARAEELDRLGIVKSTIYTSGERDPRLPPPRPPDEGKTDLMPEVAWAIRYHRALRFAPDITWPTRYL